MKYCFVRVAFLNVFRGPAEVIINPFADVHGDDAALWTNFFRELPTRADLFVKPSEVGPPCSLCVLSLLR